MAGLFGGGTITNREDRIGSIQINTAEYGSVVPEVLGTTRISGNVIYYDDFEAHEHVDRQHVGKGGGQTYENVWYTYSVAVMFGLCEGPISGIGRVWRNKDVFSYPSSAIELTLADGSQTSPWVYVEQHHPKKAIVYDGLAYMAGVVNLGRTTALPQFSFEVMGKLLETGDGVDVNPADYILYILHRVGLKDAQIEGIDSFRSYCAQADILISSPSEVDAAPAQKIVNDIAELTNSYVFWSNDRFKIIPVSDEPIGSWVPDKTVMYDLSADDFLPQGGGKLVTYQRKDTSQAYNQVTVEFINRSNFYERESVSYEDTKSIGEIGLKAAPVKSCHYLYTKARAARLAEQLCRRSVYGRNRYTFKLDWAFCRLEPADLVSITDEALGLDKKVVIVDSVTEEKDGTITVTAIERPKGYYAPAVIRVHETDRPSIDFNAPPSSVSGVLFIQPPADLAGSGNEVWMAVNASKNWGGAHVWVSDSGDSYRYIGMVHGRARAGVLAKGISSTDTEMEIDLFHGELMSGTEQDARRGNTVCFVGGEYISYTKAELLANGHYRLSGLLRGLYGVQATDHDSGVEFCRLDSSLFRYRYRDADIGKNIFVKLTSLNMFGAAEEDISSVKVWEYEVGQPYVPPLSAFHLFTRYHDLGRGAMSYDVVAQFDEPKFSSFDTVELWYFDGHWTFGGSGINEISLSGCELGKSYTVKLYVKDKYGHRSRRVIGNIRVEMKADVPNAPKGFSVTFADRAYFSWLEVTNADIDFYEIRMNKAPGDENGLIGRSNSTMFAGMLTSRTGRVFLYAHNPSEGYSAPAELTYSVPIPPMPTDVRVRAVLEGVSLTFAPVPEGCKGANIYFDDRVIFTTTNAIFIPSEGGVHSVRISYIDIFGEGEKTNEILVTVKLTIPKVLQDAEARSKESIDQALSDLDERIKSGVEDVVGSEVKSKLRGVESQVTQLSDTIRHEVKDKINGLKSDIIQLPNAVESRVMKNLNGKEIISRINQSPETITLDSRYLHIGGQTKIDGDLIARNIGARSITADKMNVSSLSAISANIGHFRSSYSGARVEISDSLITVYDNNNTLRVKLGVWVKE